MTNSNDFLGKSVLVKMDRPLGSKHPKHNFVYPVNYGYVPDTISGDSEELDAYVLGVEKPVTLFQGKCIAIIHRTDDNDDKLIVVPEEMDFSDKEIEEKIHFQEQWFNHIIIRNKVVFLTGNKHKKEITETDGFTKWYKKEKVNADSQH